MKWFEDRYRPYHELREAVTGKVDPEDFEELLAVTKAKSRKRGRAIVCLFIVFILATAIVLVRSVQSNIVDYIGFGALAFVFIVAIVDAVIERERMTKVFAQLLIQRGIRPNICLRCEYDLRGTVDMVCPECGEPLAPPTEQRP